MDLLPVEIKQPIEFIFKLFFIISSCIIIGLVYFHIKEAKKMEKKLLVSLPGSVHVVMSIQLFMSLVFLVLSIAIIFF